MLQPSCIFGPNHSNLFLMKQFFSFLAASLLVATSVFAQDREFADYGIGLGISPFGPAVNLTHNLSEQTSVVIGLGGFGDPGTGVDVEFGDQTYTTEGETSWMGIFVNHRPFADAAWFRINTGIGIGGIQGTVTSALPIHDDEYDTYDVRYQNNPVGYLGVGFGSKPVQGIQLGFDLGILSTAGATVTRTTDPEEAAEHPDEYPDISGDIPNNIFFGRFLPNAQFTVTYGF